MKTKPLGKSKYVKAKTPTAKQKQKAAIIGYYTKKRAEEKSLNIQKNNLPGNFVAGRIKQKNK